jgi:predicted TIM-barrel fold metal-dependent hydrolase
MILDFHSHWGTRRGYPFRTDAELAHQKRVWKQEPVYVSEREMADYFRENKIQAILDLGFTKYLALDELVPLHDYALTTQRQHNDVILGNWLQINPELGASGVREFERCLALAASDRSRSLVGLCVSGAALGIPASDPSLDPFYRLAVEARAPVLILVGYTALGAGLPGGRGVVLDLCHPRYLDQVAARYPDLTIIAGRPAWPWQDDMIAVVLHKPNVWYELHGWSPKYFSDSLKREIPRRLRERVLFGADYPVLRYERLLSDWRAEGYDEQTLERVFWRNGQELLRSLEYL